MNCVMCSPCNKDLGGTLKRKMRVQEVTDMPLAKWNEIEGKKLG